MPSKSRPRSRPRSRSGSPKPNPATRSRARRTRSRGQPRSRPQTPTGTLPDGFPVLEDMQQLLNDKDVCILELEESIQEMRQLLEAAVVRNDALRCKIKNCKEMILHEEEKAKVVQEYLEGMHRFMGKGICSAPAKPNWDCDPCGESKSKRVRPRGRSKGRSRSKVKS